jgi:hypothetical protein
VIICDIADALSKCRQNTISAAESGTNVQVLIILCKILVHLDRKTSLFTSNGGRDALDIKVSTNNALFKFLLCSVYEVHFVFSLLFYFLMFSMFVVIVLCFCTLFLYLITAHVF